MVSDDDTREEVVDALYDSADGQGMVYIEAGVIYTDGERYYFTGGSCYFDETCGARDVAWMAWEWWQNDHYFTEALLNADLDVVAFERSAYGEWTAPWESTEYASVLDAPACF